MATLLKLTQWNPSFSYTQQRNHLPTPHYRFFSKPQRKPCLQISCEHKQLYADSKFDSTDQIAVRMKKGGGRIGGMAAFWSPPSSSSSPCLWDIVVKFLRDRYSVVKLQVGLLSSGRTIQQDLNRLAKNADTSTREGLRDVLKEAALYLLRHSDDHGVSCYSSVDVKRREEEGENRFNRLSFDELGNFDVETLVNVNNIKRKSSKFQRASHGFSEDGYIVVTILVVVKGTIQKMKPINRIADLKEALGTLGSIPESQIMAVEVLWTPQDDKEALSEGQLLKDYSVLKPFS